MSTRQWFYSAICLVGIAASSWCAEKRAASSLTVQERQTAYSVAVSRISVLLKAPSTAHFAPIEEAVFSIGKSTIDVRLNVDAQNSYGAMLRNAWWCKVHPQQRPDGLYRVSCLEGLGLIPKDRVVGFTGAK